MDHVLIPYTVHPASWWWLAVSVVPIVLLVGVIAIIRRSRGVSVQPGYVFFIYLFLSSLSIMALCILMQDSESDDARHPSTERVADAFGLTPTDDTGINFADAHNTRYTDCYTRSHLVSPTQISAQLFCLKGGQSITMHTNGH